MRKVFQPFNRLQFQAYHEYAFRPLPTLTHVILMSLTAFPYIIIHLLLVELLEYCLRQMRSCFLHVDEIVEVLGHEELVHLYEQEYLVFALFDYTVYVAHRGDEFFEQVFVVYY